MPSDIFFCFSTHKRRRSQQCLKVRSSKCSWDITKKNTILLVLFVRDSVQLLVAMFCKPGLTSLMVLNILRRNNATYSSKSAHHNLETRNGERLFPALRDFSSACTLLWVMDYFPLHNPFSNRRNIFFRYSFIIAMENGLASYILAIPFKAKNLLISNNYLRIPFVRTKVKL